MMGSFPQAFRATLLLSCFTVFKNSGMNTVFIPEFLDTVNQLNNNVSKTAKYLDGIIPSRYMYFAILLT